MRITPLAIISVLTIALHGCGSASSAFVEACEEELKDRLRSPSGYVRVNVDVYTEPLTADQYLGLQDDDFPVTLRRAYEDGTRQAYLLTAFIEYDAPNAYGTPVRGLSMCEYVSRDGDSPNPSAMDVSVDGKTHMERLRDLVL